MDNTVLSIAAAPDGAMWFGTAFGGASRFDAETWTTYTKANGLPDNQVNAVAVAPDGVVWFGTEHGASRYLPQQP